MPLSIIALTIESNPELLYINITISELLSFIISSYVLSILSIFLGSTISTSLNKSANSHVVGA